MSFIVEQGASTYDKAVQLLTPWAKPESVSVALDRRALVWAWNTAQPSPAEGKIETARYRVLERFLSLTSQPPAELDGIVTGLAGEYGPLWICPAHHLPSYGPPRDPQLLDAASQRSAHHFDPIAPCTAARQRGAPVPPTQPQSTSTGPEGRLERFSMTVISFEEPIDRWAQLAQAAKALIEISRALKDNQLADIDQWEPLFEHLAIEVPDAPGADRAPRQTALLFHVLPQPARTREPEAASSDPELARLALGDLAGQRRAVQAIVGHWLACSAVGVSLRWDDSDPFLAVGASTLFGAIAASLAMSITDYKGLAFCGYCAAPHVPSTHIGAGRSSYCDPHRLDGPRDKTREKKRAARRKQKAPVEERLEPERIEPGSLKAGRRQPREDGLPRDVQLD